MIVLNSIFLKLTGNTGVAAYGVIANVTCVTTAVFNGIAQEHAAADQCCLCRP